ncbi:MAG: Mrr restriction system protein [Sedimentisphaerales bacterium]|nr:Mrr restriction system protein [Sedimentisphaerales bacterium]
MSAPKENSTRKLAAKLIFMAFQILKERGGSESGREIIKEIEKRSTFTEWEKETYEKTGNIRWNSVLHFYTIDCIKAGYLIKKKGVWYLTPEGEDALQLGEDELLNRATQAYRKWDRERKVISENISPELAEEDEGSQATAATIDEIEQKAMEGLESYLTAKNPYEIQDLVAALLRGMGYYTPFNAPKGKDGGIDIIAYKDPLGTESPRMRVQVKHRQNPTSAKDIRELIGLLRKDGDIGIFVSTSGFTSDAKTTARTASVHIELIDLPRLIELWQNFYSKMVDEDKNLLPLVPIYFLAPQE